MGCSVRLKWLDCIIIISAVISAMLYPQRRSLRILLMNQKNTLNITSQANTSFLIFNRNPKAASQTIWKLLDKLQYPNHFYSSHDSFEVKKLIKGEKVYLPKEEQEIYIKMFMDESRQVPYTYSKHINFINFQEFGLQNPIYINFVRVPVDKVISWYYYRRQNWYMFESTDALKEGSPFEFPALLKMTFEDCVHQSLPECTFDIGSSIHYGPNGGNHISQVSVKMAFLKVKVACLSLPFRYRFSAECIKFAMTLAVRKLWHWPKVTLIGITPWWVWWKRCKNPCKSWKTMYPPTSDTPLEFIMA